MKRELKIRLERFGRTVIGEVLDMDESELGNDTIFESNNKIVKKIISRGKPELTHDILFVRGIVGDKYNESFLYTYESIEEAQQAYLDIIRLVNEYNKQLNKPKFEGSKEFDQQVEINKLLMDMRKWQFENDEKVDPTIVEDLYCIYVDIDECVEIKIYYSRLYRDMGVVYFSSFEKAEECKSVFENRIKEIYGQ